MQVFMVLGPYQNIGSDGFAVAAFNFGSGVQLFKD